MLQFTRKELSRYNGKDGAPAYFAYQGKVYDASRSFLWRNGRHWVRHLAGKDFTGCLADAPHGEDMLERLPVIGYLVD